MSRICIGIACSAAMVTAAGALAQQAGQSSTRPQSHPQTQAAPQNHAKGVVNVQKSSDTSTAQQLLQRLAGEWEGQVQVRGTDGFNSASVISASNKLEDNGRSLASCLTGMAFAKSFEGASVIRLSNSGISGSWVDSYSKSTLTAAANSSGCTEGSATLSGSFTRDAKQFKVEQALTMSDNDHYILEVTSISAEGRRTLLVRLDLTRLPAGQVAEANAKFKDAPLLTQLRNATTKSAQASADKGE